MTSPLVDIIHKIRPNLGASSIKTYDSILRNLHKRVFDGPVDIENFTKTKPVLEFLHSVPFKSRKTILSALVVLTGLDAYRQQMMEDIQKYNAETALQEKTPKQRENSVDANVIKTLWNALKRDADFLYKKDKLTTTDLQIIQNFVILTLFSGLFIPPRRSLDYVLMKIKNPTKEDNYIEKSKFHFNKYKTSKTYQEQIVDIPKPLMTILKRWLAVNPTEFLLFDTHFKPLTSVKLTQRLNKIFDGKIAVNSLRHAFLTDKYEKTIDINKELQHDLQQMGTSPAMSKVYIQHS